MQKTLRLVTLLAWGLCIPAYAQAPTFSLPPIPGAGAAPSSPVPAPAKAPENPKSDVSLPPPLPGLENMVEAPAEEKDVAEEPKKEIAKDEKAADKSAPDSTPDSVPEIGQANASVAPYNVAPLPLTLDKPAPEAEKKTENVTAPPPLPTLALPAPPVAGNLQATAIPEMKTEAKPARPTWKDELKPSYKPVQTSFNFRRQVLPPTIYRDYYGNENRHLPLARSMPQYDHYFIIAAARNDVNGVRAMLANGRRNVNLMNAEGDSVLLVALRHGALQTAKLLIARGADTSVRGANGWSAYDYAAYWGDAELLAALQG